ncbi:MAG: hypothetical protein M3N43_14675 [Actinomycetota bacterium]|nr:hypothetical protein [Actinomycetota bacterium]
MALGKDDNPKSTKAALQDSTDEAAGVPGSYEDAAEALPEKDEVQTEIKAAMLAETGQEEAEHKANVVDASPNSADTPSGAALKATAGISDNRERGEEYARVKSAVRWGYVHPSLEKDPK